jgi:hypothetical protein
MPPIVWETMKPLPWRAFHLQPLGKANSAKQQQTDDRIDRTLFDDASMIRPLISSSFARAAKPQGLPTIPIGTMRTQAS